MNRMYSIVLTLALVLAPLKLAADAIMRSEAMTATSIAEYFITDKGVRIDLEIGVEALPYFRHLAPGYGLTLDWKDPWYRAFNAFHLKRQHTAERMKELGLEWAVLDPAANQGDSDWLSIQYKNLSNLKTITQQGVKHGPDP